MSFSRLKESQAEGISGRRLDSAVGVWARSRPSQISPDSVPLLGATVVVVVLYVVEKMMES